MSDAKPVGHTTGPWIIHGNGSRRDRYLAVIDSIPDRDGKVMANCICYVATTNPDAEANARLIAAAPGLLEALQRLHSQVNTHFLCSEEKMSESMRDAYNETMDILCKVVQ